MSSFGGDEIIVFESNESDEHDFDEHDELSHKMVKPHEENKT